MFVAVLEEGKAVSEDGDELDDKNDIVDEDEDVEGVSKASVSVGRASGVGTADGVAVMIPVSVSA